MGFSSCVCVVSLLISGPLNLDSCPFLLTVGEVGVVSKDTPAKGGELMSFEPKDLEQLWQQICSSDPDQPVPARIACVSAFCIDQSFP